MSPDSAAVVRRYFDELFGMGNLAALDEVISPEFVGHSATYGHFTIEDVRRDIAREHVDMPGDETNFEDQFIAGDRVVTRWRYQWRHDSPLVGEQPTGVWLEMAGVHVDRVVDGKIVERWEVKDFWGVVQQLGGRVVFDELPESSN